MRESNDGLFVLMWLPTTDSADQPSSAEVESIAARSMLRRSGSHISTNNPSFDSRNYGYPKLVELVRAQDYMDVEHLPDQPVRVRLRPSRPARKRAPRKQAAKKS